MHLSFSIREMGKTACILHTICVCDLLRSSYASFCAFSDLLLQSPSPPLDMVYSTPPHAEKGRKGRESQPDELKPTVPMLLPQESPIPAWASGLLFDSFP
jgi:hypothetical protein